MLGCSRSFSPAPAGVALAAALFLLPSLVQAEAPQPSRPAPPAVGAPPPAWDGSHMRSNHSRSSTSRVTRPPIQGTSGYGAMAAGTATPTRHAVARTLEQTTQREWRQGSLGRSAPRHRPQASTPPTSPRGVNAGLTRGSKLRAQSSSRRR